MADEIPLFFCKKIGTLGIAVKKNRRMKETTQKIYVKKVIIL
jgi:hypothetical protein